MNVFEVSYGIVVSHDTLRNRIMLKSFACSAREINLNESHVNRYVVASLLCHTSECVVESTYGDNRYCTICVRNLLFHVFRVDAGTAG